MPTGLNTAALNAALPPIADVYVGTATRFRTTCDPAAPLTGPLGRRARRPPVGVPSTNLTRFNPVPVAEGDARHPALRHGAECRERTPSRDRLAGRHLPARHSGQPHAGGCRRGHLRVAGLRRRRDRHAAARHHGPRRSPLYQARRPSARSTSTSSDQRDGAAGPTADRPVGLELHQPDEPAHEPRQPAPGRARHRAALERAAEPRPRRRHRRRTSIRRRSTARLSRSARIVGTVANCDADVDGLGATSTCRAAASRTCCAIPQTLGPTHQCRPRGAMASQPNTTLYEQFFRDVADGRRCGRPGQLHRWPPSAARPRAVVDAGRSNDRPVVPNTATQRLDHTRRPFVKTCQRAGFDAVAAGTGTWVHFTAGSTARSSSPAASLAVTTEMQTHRGLAGQRPGATAFAITNPAILEP